MPTMTLPGGQAPSSSGGGAEDYNYDATRDPYKARNNYFDTLEELNLVRGVGDNFWGTFGEMFTVYGGCQVNVGAIPPEKWPIMAAIIRFAAKDPTQTRSCCDDLQVAGDRAEDPRAHADDRRRRRPERHAVGQLHQRPRGGDEEHDVRQHRLVVHVVVVVLVGAGRARHPARRRQGEPGDGDAGAPHLSPRRGRHHPAHRDKKIEVHIRGIWDSEHVNQNTTSGDPNDLKGTWVYWRQD